MQALTEAFSHLLSAFSALRAPHTPPRPIAPEDILSADACATFLLRRHEELERQVAGSLFSSILTIFNQAGILAEWRIAQLDFLAFKAGQESIGRIACAAWFPGVDLPKSVELFGEQKAIPLAKEPLASSVSTLIHVSEARELRGFPLGSIVTEGFLLFMSLRHDLSARLPSTCLRATPVKE